MLNIKEQASRAKKAFMKIVNRLISTRKELFAMLDKTSTMIGQLKGVLSPLQIAKFIYSVEDKNHHSLDRYTVWGIKRPSEEVGSEIGLTDSEEENDDEIPLEISRMEPAQPKEEEKEPDQVMAAGTEEMNLKALGQQLFGIAKKLYYANH